MSEVEKKDVSVEATEQVQQEPPIVEKEVNEKPEGNDLIKSLEEKLNGFEDKFTTFEEKETNYKTQIRSLDRKVSEQSKKIKEYEQREMTEEEKLVAEKKEISEERQALYRDQASVQDFSNIPSLTEDDRNIIKTYFYGETKEDMYESAKSLFSIIQKSYDSGKQSGIEEALSSGYKPKRAGINGQKEDDITLMGDDEFRSLAKKIAKMDSSDKKVQLLNELDREQYRRWGKLK